MNIDLDRITHPPRLAKGFNAEDSGKACAMQVISYITGEAMITDYPSCTDETAAAMVQYVNDRLAGAGAGVGTLLSPEDSLVALDLGWLTVGTATPPAAIALKWAEWVVGEAARRLAIADHNRNGLDHLQSARVKLGKAALASPETETSRLSGVAVQAAYSAVSGFHITDNRIEYDVTAYEEADFVKAVLLKLRELMGLDEPPAVKEEDLNSAFSRFNAGVS